MDLGIAPTAKLTVVYVVVLAVLYGHKAVQCDKCEMWIHNKCSLITESEFDSVENTNCTWICPKGDFFNFSDSFFADQSNLEYQNRFDPLANEPRHEKTGFLQMRKQRHRSASR